MTGDKTLRKLERELERLKRLLDLGHGLKVEWLPGDARDPRGRRLSGEVAGDTIRIYEEDEAAAVAALRHEFLDYAVSQAVEPYKEVANGLISVINRDAYRRKERLVERLSRLVG